jgi:tetratricopeptide (TPR) repeat protein
MATTVFEQISEAQGLYISGAYSLARDRLTQILESNANSYEALLYRAHANIKLNALEEAIKDADAAVNVNSNRSEALLVKGIALFVSGKYDDAINQIRRAQLVLSSLEAADPRRVEVQLWEQKAEAEKTKKTAFSVNNLNRKPEEQKTQTQETASVQQHPKPGKISYKWHQTDNRVYIEINFALKKKEDLNITIEKKKVSISFPVDTSSNYELNLELFDEIDTENSSYNVHLNRIEVQLEKILKGRNWTLLERPDSANEKVLETVVPKPVSQNNAPQATPVYPSSSKTKKDWSKIDKEIEEDMKKNKDDYADEDPLNKFFKEIYKNADENTRKAMMKSFQTSGGTVLSTNWDEVKQKDYEGKDRPDAPTGQEYKEWGK